MVMGNIHETEGMQVSIDGTSIQIANEVANLLHQIATKIEATTSVDYETVIERVIESTQLSRTMDMESLKIGRELTAKEMQDIVTASGMNGKIMEHK